MTEISDKSYRDQQVEKLNSLRKRHDSKEKELAKLKRMITEMESLLEKDLVAPAPAVSPEAVEGIIEALSFISQTHTDPEIVKKAKDYSLSLQQEAPRK